MLPHIHVSKIYPTTRSDFVIRNSLFYGACNSSYILQHICRATCQSVIRCMQTAKHQCLNQTPLEKHFSLSFQISKLNLILHLHRISSRLLFYSFNTVLKLYCCSTALLLFSNFTAVLQLYHCSPALLFSSKTGE
jgi:hypothetical protein